MQLTAAELVAPEIILAVWRKFDAFPMETLTKAWFLKNFPGKRQRSVKEMIEHRARFGASGNCFDLSLWLLEEFRQAKIEAYGIGHGLGTTDAHVAVIALDKQGRRYLCDLGDLWIQPLLIDGKEAVKQIGFFTGAEISCSLSGRKLDIVFGRKGGKQSKEHCDLTPVSDRDFFEFGNFSQENLSRPLVEMRLWRPGETVHWEYEDARSFVSSLSGLEEEAPCASLPEWSRRIAAATKMEQAYVLECLTAFEELANRQPAARS